MHSSNAEDSNRVSAEQQRGQAHMDVRGSERSGPQETGRTPVTGGRVLLGISMCNGLPFGEMREWLNRAASKAVELLVSSEGSNPSLSVGA